MGKAEHQENDKDVAPEQAAGSKGLLTDDPDDNVIDDEEMERRAVAEIAKEKTTEQLVEEAHREWRRFYYHPLAGPIFGLLFVVAVIQMILTLDQWHGTHGWRLPIDYQPADRRYGGWPQKNADLRFSGAILGVLANGYSWVTGPSADKYKCVFFLQILASLLLFFAFGYDLAELRKVQTSDLCSDRIPDMKIHKYICTFEDYQTTVIIGFISAFCNIAVGIYICRLALTGAVSRVLVFNEQSGEWQKYIPDPDEPLINKFPRRFRNQYHGQMLVLAFCFILNAVLLVLSATQSTGVFLEQGTDYETPAFNNMQETPVTLFVIHGDEAIRFGSWPTMNFILRLSVGTAAIVTTSFAIQWRRDGRFAQLIVILILMTCGGLYLMAFAYDLQLWLSVKDNGCQWMRANGHICLRRRYTAVVLFDVFLGLMYLGWGFYSLICFGRQMRRPGNRWASEEEMQAIKNEPIHPYGWWCFGEWAEKERRKAEEEAGPTEPVPGQD